MHDTNKKYMSIELKEELLPSKQEVIDYLND